MQPSDPYSRDIVRLGVVYSFDVGVVDGVMGFGIGVGRAEAKEAVGATQYGGIETFRPFSCVSLMTHEAHSCGSQGSESELSSV